MALPKPTSEMNITPMIEGHEIPLTRIVSWFVGFVSFVNFVRFVFFVFFVIS